MTIGEFGVYGNFLGGYGNSFPITSKEYIVDPDALYVTIEFLMYEIGQWSPDDTLVVKVEKQSIDMGQFAIDSNLQDGFSYSGGVGGIHFSRKSLDAATNIAFDKSNDQIHKISLSIPSYYFSANGKILLGFEVSIQNSIEKASAGFAKLKVIEHNRCTGNEKTTLYCDGEQNITNEDFNNNDGSWKNMKIKTLAAYGNVLGTYDRNDAHPSKSFEVPKDAEKIVIKFQFFEIGQWETGDESFVIINNVVVPFEFSKNRASYIFPEREDGGIRLIRTSDFLEEFRMHSVLITVPNKFFQEGTVKFEILLSLNQDTSNFKKSFGIDEFIMQAQGACERRLLTADVATIDASYGEEKLELADVDKLLSEQESKQTKNKVKFSDVDAEEGPYCLAKDFPCDGGGNMVYACHYSGRQGYQTFCIPENDSEILRFYAKDYCGPCVGGYGGVDWNI